MDGLSDKISGKAKQAAGKATNDNELENKGKSEEAKGILKEKAGGVLDAVSDKLDDAKKKLK